MTEQHKVVATIAPAALLVVALLLEGCVGPEGADGLPAPTLLPGPPKPLRILVIGGTAGIGLQTVKLAVERGHFVTAMARRPERMTLDHPNLDTVEGDILNAEIVRLALADQDAVVVSIGVGPTRKPVTVFSEGTRNVLDGMAATGVRRLIAITGIGAGETRGHGGFLYDRVFLPLALRTVYDDKDRQEALIRDRGDGDALDWTIVRPGFLTDDEARHQYRVITELQGITAGKIARADVAHFIIAALESQRYYGVTPLLMDQ